MLDGRISELEVHEPSVLRIGLVGSPNSGKTTLFNWLTGSSHKTVNYAGSTVQCVVGTLKLSTRPIEILDTPGIYETTALSIDEQKTWDLLSEAGHQLDGVVMVMDYTQLRRQLHLLEEVRRRHNLLGVVLTMADLSAKVEEKAKRLSELWQIPVFPVSGRLGLGVRELAANLESLSGHRGSRLEKQKFNLEHVFDEHDRHEEDQLFQRWALSVDEWLLHPVLGWLFFVLIMASLFSSIFWLASPFMDGIDQGFSALGEMALQILPPFWGTFLADGVIAGMGAVFVFIPQIFILFFLLGLLEDSGYLSRAATLIDRPMQKLGLSGRAFIPLLSGFACAVPAMMATRGLRSIHERWLSLFILPLMSCSARLPVYALLLSLLFFGQSALYPGLALTGLYLGSIVAGCAVALLISRWSPARHHKSALVMELPFYRWPRWSTTLRSSFRRTKAYVVNAGPIIFGFALVLWFLMQFPNFAEPDPAVRMQTSYAAQMGRWIEPLVEPMGLDWRVGVGLISAFAAREVFVASLAVVFQVTEDAESEGFRASILSTLKDATHVDGTPIFTVPSVLGLILFFMIALQCLSTTAMARHEFGGWKWPFIQLVTLNVFAYVLAVITYQSARVLLG